MWLCICWGTQFEETFENSLWRKAVQMQPMRLRVCPCRRFEKTLESSLWRKTAQMKPMWLCVSLGTRLKKAFENSLLRKKRTYAATVTLHLFMPLFWILTMVKNYTNADNLTLYLLRQSKWGDFLKKHMMWKNCKNITNVTFHEHGQTLWRNILWPTLERNWTNASENPPGSKWYKLKKVTVHSPF